MMTTLVINNIHHCHNIRYNKYNRYKQNNITTILIQMINNKRTPPKKESTYKSYNN